MAELTFTVGRLLCGAVRRSLEKIAFRNPNVRWRESNGWIDREFQVFGPADDLLRLKEVYENWYNRLENEDE